MRPLRARDERGRVKRWRWSDTQTLLAYLGRVGACAGEKRQVERLSVCLGEGERESERENEKKEGMGRAGNRCIIITHRIACNWPLVSHWLERRGLGLHHVEMIRMENGDLAALVCPHFDAPPASPFSADRSARLGFPPPAFWASLCLCLFTRSAPSCRVSPIAGSSLSCSTPCGASPANKHHPRQLDYSTSAISSSSCE
ncbi:unnamed protein product [Protopolystoma xenopodis]|uniref:Uncharacterized protein n=1 Tax=Protopolystoma xenopodis TaxID=117903 RepID=A0A448X865_9PLAT|nr:unnamed protein product [Protopolystoma xenopodis]